MHIAVFASGTGTTLQTLIERQADCGYQIALVVANRQCMAIERAEAAAEHYFCDSAAGLNRYEANDLAARLPDPRR